MATTINKSATRAPTERQHIFQRAITTTAKYVLPVERNKIFSFTFDPAGIVDVHFKTIGNQGTEDILNQSEVPVEGADWYQYFYGCSLGWSFWLVNLKAWLEYGITLDEREIQYDGDEKYQVINQ